ncbi:hypothetical protein L7F22_004147 [Adiantum nelumboides]|nr:hypothetical protein [Adiantum nelumboides]
MSDFSSPSVNAYKRRKQMAAESSDEMCEIHAFLLEDLKVPGMLGRVKNPLLKCIFQFKLFSIRGTVCAKCGHFVLSGQDANCARCGSVGSFLLKRHAVRGVYFGVLLADTEARNTLLELSPLFFGTQMTHVLPWALTKDYQSLIRRRCPVWVEIVDFPRTWQHFLPMLASYTGKVICPPKLDANTYRFWVLWDTNVPTPEGVTPIFQPPPAAVPQLAVSADKEALVSRTPPTRVLTLPDVSPSDKGKTKSVNLSKPSNKGKLKSTPDVKKKGKIMETEDGSTWLTPKKNDAKTRLQFSSRNYVPPAVKSAVQKPLPRNDNRTITGTRSSETQTMQKPADAASVSKEEDLWNLARLKLLHSMDLVDDMEDYTRAESTGQGLQLSLQALARGPRLRLLLITLEELNKEVKNWQEQKCYLHPDWSGFSTQRLCELIVPICRLWMCGEHIRNSKGQTSMKGDSFLPESIDDSLLTEWNLLFDSYSQSYGQSKSMKSGLLATGKAEFYADFLYILCSGCVRQNGYFGAECVRSHKNLVLDDLLIFVADKASALYLDLISTGSTIGDSQWFNMMSQSIPSTRLLEKFRNEVALNGWLNDNFQSVTAMFEDRFDLWILNSGHKNHVNQKNQSSKVRLENHREQDSGKSAVVIGQYKMFARRARELRRLTGWRYYFSLYLEFSDICGPLLRTVATKLGEGISFLLVTLIGRSLGLIYRGICQSIQWNSG